MPQARAQIVSDLLAHLELRVEAAKGFRARGVTGHVQLHRPGRRAPRRGHRVGQGREVELGRLAGAQVGDEPRLHRPGLGRLGKDEDALLLGHQRSNSVNRFAIAILAPNRKKTRANSLRSARVGMRSWARVPSGTAVNAPTARPRPAGKWK